MQILQQSAVRLNVKLIKCLSSCSVGNPDKSTRYVWLKNLSLFCAISDVVVNNSLFLYSVWDDFYMCHIWWLNRDLDLLMLVFSLVYVKISIRRFIVWMLGYSVNQCGFLVIDFMLGILITKFVLVELCLCFMHERNIFIYDGVIVNLLVVSMIFSIHVAPYVCRRSTSVWSI